MNSRDFDSSYQLAEKFVCRKEGLGDLVGLEETQLKP
jgi:hypothetical protein